MPQFKKQCLITLVGTALMIGAAPGSASLIYLRLHSQLAAGGADAAVAAGDAARWAALAGFLMAQLEMAQAEGDSLRSALAAQAAPGAGVLRRPRFAANRHFAWLPALGPADERFIPPFMTDYKGPTGLLGAGMGAARIGAGARWAWEDLSLDGVQLSSNRGPLVLGPQALGAINYADTKLQLPWYLTRIAELYAAMLAQEQNADTITRRAINKEAAVDTDGQAIAGATGQATEDPADNGTAVAALTTDDPVALPEPSAAALLALGVCGLFLLRRRRFPSRA